MIALRDGEQLAYQVSVRSPFMEKEDKGVYVQQAEEHMASTEARGSGQVTTPDAEASDMVDEGDEVGCQDKDHIDVEEFVASPLGKKFYEEWKEGRVGPQIIGRRFGYGVLGAYASMWENEKEASEQMASRGEGDGGGRSEDMPPADVEDLKAEAEGQGQGSFRLNPPPAAPLQIGDSQSSEPHESDLGPMADEAASSSTREASLTGTSGLESGGRIVQTNLKRWLL